MNNSKKDNRTVYTNKEIEVNGNRIHFDGKYNPENKTLKVYKYRGDIHLAEQAFKSLAISENIEIDKIIAIHSR